MQRTRRSLFYVAGYLLSGGIGFLFFPQTVLPMFMSNGDYSSVMVRFVGLLLVSLGIFVVQLIRHNARALYSTTLVARSVILLSLVWFYIAYQDPLMLVLSGIVGVGYIITLTCYIFDRKDLLART